MADAILARVPRIQRTEVDGIPALWVDEPGPFIGTLTFRVGRADEPTPLAGITHIVEHLALSRLGVQDYDHNGFVDSQSTVFTTVGRPDEVRAFFESVVSSLLDLPVDRLLLERRILREERDQQGPSIGGAARWYRYGYAGQGRGLGPGDDQIGLDWLGPERIEEWVRRHFTRDNAILWFTGPVPDGLHLDLPAGTRAPAPSIEPVHGLQFPVHVPWDGPAATLAMTGDRSSALNMGANIAVRRARQQLRFDRALVYDCDLDYEPVAPDTAHVTLGANCRDDAIAEVADGLLGIVRDLAGDGPTPRELEQELDAWLRISEDRDARIGVLAGTAFDMLWDGPVRTIEQLGEERRSVDSESAARAMAAALDTLLVLANCPPIDGLREYPIWSTSRVEGSEFRPGGFHLPGRAPKSRLIVGADGVTAVEDGSHWTTIRYADVVACVHSEPHVRSLLSRDGSRLTLVPTDWRDGARMIAEVDRAVPSELVACPEHGIGGLADPAPGPSSPS